MLSSIEQSLQMKSQCLKAHVLSVYQRVLIKDFTSCLEGKQYKALFLLVRLEKRN